MKHIVCYSGGHSSALVAIEVTRKFGKENVILLNHDINPNVESSDIKRFKKEVSDYLGIPVTYANINGITNPEDIPDQFDVTVKARGFKFFKGTEICTSRLKTEPFKKYLDKNFPDKECIIYYGFDLEEKARIQRRSSILAEMGFRSDYPLALWKDRTIFDTQEIGILRPNTYEMFKHGNCQGCLKAGRQHWYIVYCTRPDIWEKAKQAEDDIGYTIIKGTELQELEPLFEKMKSLGIEPTEHVKPATYWANVRKTIKLNFEVDSDNKPCECVF